MHLHISNPPIIFLTLAFLAPDTIIDIVLYGTIKY